MSSTSFVPILVLQVMVNDTGSDKRIKVDAKVVYCDRKLDLMLLQTAKVRNTLISDRANCP